MPQNQKTEPTALINPDDLPDLTDKQLAFVTHVLEGKTYADAYRLAYDVTGFTSENAIWVEACRTAANSKVSLWLKAAKQHSFRDTTTTLETHTRRLAELSQRAENAGNYGAAVQAEVHIGKATGLYVDKVENVNESREWAILDRIFKQHGMTAVLLAGKRLGKDAHELEAKYGATH